MHANSLQAMLIVSMLTEDKSLIARDPDIVALEIILNEQLMLPLIKQHFPRLKAVSASKQYIRYKTSTNCLVKYQVIGTDETHELYVKAFTHKDDIKLLNLSKLQEDQASHTQGTNINRYVVLEYKLVFYGFPYDEKLKILPRLINDTSREELLPRVLKESLDCNNTQITTLQYKPERRFVAKLTLPSGEHSLIKAYTATRYHHANKMCQLKMDSKRLLTITGRSSKHHMMGYRWIEGSSLTEKYQLSDFDPEYISATGRYLARFHLSKKKDLVAHNQHAFTDTLFQLGVGINQLLPALNTRITSLVPALIEAVQSLNSKQRRIHGDFYSKQVLITDQGIQLIDFDDMCLWFPAYDLGLFIAHLERDNLSGLLPDHLATTYSDELLKGYQQVSNYSQTEVELFTAIGLLQLAHHPFRNAHKQWPQIIEAIITLCEEHFQRYLTLLSAHQTQNNRPVCLEKLKDTQYMQTPLIELFQTKQNRGKITRLESIRLLRHKPEKRSLLEYNFYVDDGDKSHHLTILGKVRTKSFDKHAWKINAELYNDNFNELSHDRIQVPRPMGQLRSSNIWFQRKVDGETIFSTLCDDTGEGLAHKIAECLHKLHTSRVKVTRTHTIDDEMLALEDYLNNVGNNNSKWRTDIDIILLRCRSLSTLLPQNQQCIIHRDFYQDQLIINGDSLYLLDLDLCCLGDPALDIGNFIAHIQEQCLRDFDDLNYANIKLDALSAHYQQLSNRNLNMEIEIYSLLSWARHIFISQRITDRNPFTPAIISQCFTLSSELLVKYSLDSKV
ncbi:phosphotransferase [Vibrio lamellibrachiae]|uniref:phosphotransferase n=1 Tax=Vibrio lamellibrachiae TaxID=2910253 RepID=UPI003D0A994F